MNGLIKKIEKFQPRNEIRGVIVRTYFYISDKYNVNLSDSEHKLIEQIQGNDNKFVTQQCN
ncbi:endonuclease [Gilliamella sp. B2772]|nr:endonuclease [Gilliamella sp. B2772]